jgi:SP family myo-inositol transporter-like MFS transporter 13
MGDRNAVDEPLLANNADAVEETAHDLPETLSNDIGSLFIWTLTLSAGISGLLFGYEYENRKRAYV